MSEQRLQYSCVTENSDDLTLGMQAINEIGQLAILSIFIIVSVIVIIDTCGIISSSLFKLSHSEDT